MIKTVLAISFVGLITGLTWLGVDYLFQKNTLQIKEIVMLNKPLKQDISELEVLANATMDGGFFSLDIEHFRETIETLPWVETVSVRKKWPNTLQLNIKERKVAARWINTNKNNRTIKKLREREWDEQSLLSNKGVVFKTGLTKKQYSEYKGLAIYSSPDELSSQGLEKCLKITQLLKQVKLNIRQCFQDQRRSWYVSLTNGFNLFLGSAVNSAMNSTVSSELMNKDVINTLTESKTEDKILQKVKVFVKAYKQILKKYDENIERIDMRYTNGFAIKWKAKRV